MKRGVILFEPNNKLSNKMWVGKSSDRSVVARRAEALKELSNFDSDGIVARDAVPQRGSVT
jgi:hypothetical protein